MMKPAAVWIADHRVCTRTAEWVTAPGIVAPRKRLQLLTLLRLSRRGVGYQNAPDRE
jgi:hypothetical protein